MSDVPSSEIRDALRQWLRESLTLLAHQPLTMIELPEVRLNPDDDGWSVEGYSQVPDSFRLVRSAGEVLEALPGLSEITEILRRYPESGGGW